MHAVDPQLFLVFGGLLNDAVTHVEGMMRTMVGLLGDALAQSNSTTTMTLLHSVGNAAHHLAAPLVSSIVLQPQEHHPQVLLVCRALRLSQDALRLRELAAARGAPRRTRLALLGRSAPRVGGALAALLGRAAARRLLRRRLSLLAVERGQHDDRRRWPRGVRAQCLEHLVAVKFR